jgi:hypothetical protein
MVDVFPPPLAQFNHQFLHVCALVKEGVDPVLKMCPSVLASDVLELWAEPSQALVMA